MGRNAAEIRIVDAIDVGSVERVVAAGDEVYRATPCLRSAIKLAIRAAVRRCLTVRHKQRPLGDPRDDLTRDQ